MLKPFSLFCARMFRRPHTILIAVSLSVVLAIILAYLGVTLALDNREMRSNLDSTSMELETTTQELSSLSEELATTSDRLESTEDELESTTEGLTATTGELATTSDRLESTEDELESTTEALTATTGELATTSDRLESTEDELESTTEALTATTGELATTSDRLESTEDELESTTEALTATTGELATTSDRLESTEDELESTTEALTATTGELATTSDRLDATERELATTSTQLAGKELELSDLVAQAGTVEALRTQQADLQAEIAELKAQRTPLIPQTHVDGFACTGSMEPVITCMDTARWLINYDPYDIVVGAVISFTPPEDCIISSSRTTAHRVTEIQREEGHVAFRTRGDINPKDDGCWITPDDVEAYLTALYKDTRPQWSGLRDKVNGARARIDEARAAYLDWVTRYCNKRGRTYQCGSNYFQTAIRLFEETAASEAAYNCWIKNAKEQPLSVWVASYECIELDGSRS